jgi:hypothetical protein
MMPDLTAEERQEAYLLLRHFQITWHERVHVYEAWEIENALAFLRVELNMPDADTEDTVAPDTDAEDDDGEFKPGSWATPPELPML